MRISQLSNNAKGAAIAAVAGIIYMIEGRELETGTASMPQEGFIPAIVGVALLLLCLALVLKEALGKTLFSGEGEEDENFSWKRPLLLIGVLLLYPALLPVFGFLVTTPVLLFAVFRIFNYRTLPRSAFAALLCTAVAYGTLDYWLKVVSFPAGILFM